MRGGGLGCAGIVGREPRLFVGSDGPNHCPSLCRSAINAPALTATSQERAQVRRLC